MRTRSSARNTSRTDDRTDKCTETPASIDCDNDREYINVRNLVVRVCRLSGILYDTTKLLMFRSRIII